MKQYLNNKDQWHIREEEFHKEYNRISESVMSLGNGHMGLRANFEEDFSGDSLQGSYMAGVYYPDKTRVGWWKNGYPEYFAKVLNSTNWIGIHLRINDNTLDLQQCEIIEFTRDLDMQKGILSRNVQAKTSEGIEFSIETRRFVSMKRLELGTLQYRFTLLNSNASIELESYLDGNVYNEDSNYNEYFWNPLESQSSHGLASVTLETKKTGFICHSALISQVYFGQEQVQPAEELSRSAYASHIFRGSLSQDESLELTKYVINNTNRDHKAEDLAADAEEKLKEAVEAGFDLLKQEQQQAWQQKWEQSDIIIEGAPEAQQGIRFNIFQLNQTYSGHDARLNIGPKGFTGEKYGGSTYWDTEAYCLPFYLSTADEEIARNLVIYRYKQLPQAIENAEKLGFSGGAALYPMVTMTGEECHNEWEITFEEIHRNGAIAHGIWNYINYTGDKNYLLQGGLEVLIGISRFWSQRVNWSEFRKQYVMLGVTGPNEYENNVNNNWYTNRIAAWCMDYTRESIEWALDASPDSWKTIKEKTEFRDEEIALFEKISSQMYYPEDTTRQVFLQQDGFLDKELLPVDHLKNEERPISQNWSWDRILRSCYIKQADVLQGLFFLESYYDTETIRRNFDFYEPMTVHESSLSPCVYSILANKIGHYDKAYDLYLRTARLDLDDYNNDTEDGCHTTSMAGTWMSVVYGFGGFRVINGTISLSPNLPEKWDLLSFRLLFRGRELKIKISREECQVSIIKGAPMTIMLNNQEIELS